MSPRQLGKKPAGPRKGTNQPAQHNKDDKVHKANKVHKRSRDGCFTCRLRRKKCSETRPFCNACVSLGIPCEYNQPVWGSTQAARDVHHLWIAQQIKDNKVACKPAKALKARESSSKTSGDLVEAPTLPVQALDWFDEPLGVPESTYYTPEATPSSRDSGTPAHHLYYLPRMQDPDFTFDTLDFDNMVVPDGSSEYPDLVEAPYGQPAIVSFAPPPYQNNAGPSLMSQNFSTSNVNNGQQTSALTALPYRDDTESVFMNQFATNDFNNGQQAGVSTAIPFQSNAGSSFMDQNFATNNVNSFMPFDDTMILPAFHGHNTDLNIDINSNSTAPFVNDTQLSVENFDTSNRFFSSNSTVPFVNETQLTGENFDTPNQFFSSNSTVPFINETQLSNDNFDTPNQFFSSNSTVPFINETQTSGGNFDAPSQFFSESDLLWSDASELGEFQSSYDTPNLAVSVTDTNSIVPAGDQPHLDHFLQHIALFPVLDICTSGTVSTNVVLPALSTSYTVLQSALTVAAIHKRAHNDLFTEDIARDIYRFRASTIRSMMRSFTDETELQDVLQSVLLPIYLHTLVASAAADIPDRAWHLQLGDHANLIFQPWAGMSDRAKGLAPLNTAIAFWFDIQGSVLRRSVPLFLATYRQALVEGAPAGMGELMGCDDHVMYTIAEIAELDASLSPDTAMEPGTAAFIACWGRIDELMEQLHLGVQYSGGNVLTQGLADPPATSLRSTVTGMYRLVAEIYLISLQPNSNPLEDPTSTRLFDLVETFASLMARLSAGPDGLDCHLTWLFLIAGSYSTPKSTFRALFMSRFDQVGKKAELGNLVRIKNILMEVWHHNDASVMDGTCVFRHWRHVMRENRQGRDWSDVLFL